MNILPVVRYRLSYRAISAIDWPDYAGSTLRGALGHALKSMACPTAQRPQDDCACTAAQSCAYRDLFDPADHLDANGKPRSSPAPMVIEPMNGGHVLAAGQTAHFDFVLIGQHAQQHLPLLERAWQQALRDGVGDRVLSGQRGDAEMLTLTALNQPKADFLAADRPDYAHVQLFSPLRLQENGQITQPQQFNAHGFLWSLVRRYHLLLQLYGQAQPIDDTLHTAIEKVGTQQQLQWKDWTRWSNRQKKTMKLSGLSGYFLLENLSPVLWPYLYAGQWLHVGKNSMFGLGHYQLLLPANRSGG